MEVRLFGLSDPYEEVYRKYVRRRPPPPDVSSEPCPKCKSMDVNRKAGYRGEYTCRKCGHFWRR